MTSILLVANHKYEKNNAISEPMAVIIPVFILLGAYMVIDEASGRSEYRNTEPTQTISLQWTFDGNFNNWSFGYGNY